MTRKLMRSAERKFGIRNSEFGIRGRLHAKRVVSFVLLLGICFTLLTGCREQTFIPQQPPPPPPQRDEAQIRLEVEQFDLLLDEMFAEIAVSDSITLNYFVADPSWLDIEPTAPTYGEVTSQQTIEREREETRELYEKLTGFRYENLRPDQQIIYDILMRTINLSETMERNDDYSYYLGYVYPISGVQVQLPILLAEFNFRTVDDIEIYLRLLEDTHRFFGEMIEFERERSRRGFFMSDANVDEVIANCESFLENREDNLLVLVFDNKVDQHEGLSPEQREEFKQGNHELVLNSVLTAYDMLVDAMRELRGRGANQRGLANLPSGTEFAEVYLQQKTGSDRTPLEIVELIYEQMDKAMGTVQFMLGSNPGLMEAYLGDTLGSILDERPETYLRILEKKIEHDFPAMEPVQYVVREVHESLQEFISPAFYLTPAIDDPFDNVIYINPSKITDNLSLFTTLAHEGYAGHLYQNVYFLQRSPHPLRRFIGNLGYTEGWATYAEMQSYYYSGLSDAEAALMLHSRSFDLMLITLIDLGINALNWEDDLVTSLLGTVGLDDPATIAELIRVVTADPLSYLPYCLGYFEFTSLRDEAEMELGRNFELIEFHRFVLDIGPAPFQLIREHMQDWIETHRDGTVRPAA